MEIIQLFKNSNLKEIENWFNSQINLEKLPKIPKSLSLLELAIIHSENEEIIKFFIEKEKNINHQNKSKRTALHFACIHGRSLEIIEMLLKKKADVNIIDSDQRIALHYCFIRKLNFEVIKLITQNTKNINSRDKEGKTPLHILLLQKDIQEILDWFLQKNPDLNIYDKKSQNPVFSLCESICDPKILDNLIKKGANVNSANYHKNNLLHIVFQRKNIPFEFIKLLVESGANCNLQNNRGNSPLHYAIKNKYNIDFINLLISHGADVNIENRLRKSPFMNACYSNYSYDVIELMLKSEPKIRENNPITSSPFYFILISQKASLKTIELLYKKGFPLKCSSYDKKNLLHYACEYEAPLEIIQFFVKNGIGVNSQDRYGKTPLHYVAQNFHDIKIAEFLIEKKAHINLESRYIEIPLLSHLYSRNISSDFIKLLLKNGSKVKSDNSQHSALIRACGHKVGLDVIKLFIDEKTNLNETDGTGFPPLYHLCYQGNDLESIKYLIGKGADVHFKTNHNENLLFIACRNPKSREIIEFLLDCGLDPNEKAFNERTALHLLCDSTGGFDFQFFFDFPNLEVSIADSYLRTPLYLSLNSRKPIEIIHKLLEKGARFGSYFNVTQLVTILSKTPQEIFELCLSYGAFDIDIMKPFIPSGNYDLMVETYYSLIEDMQNLLIRKEFSDFKIFCLNDSIQIHSLILKLRICNSKDFIKFTFPDKFFSVFKETSLEISQQFFNFIYTGFTNPQSHLISLENLLPICEKLDLDLKWIEIKQGVHGLLRDLERLFEDEESKDFKIIVGDQYEFKIHKLILIARSDLYRGMFLSVQDDSNQVRDYSEKSKETIQELLHFLYFDKIDEETSKEILEEFEDAKDYYQLNEKSKLSYELFKLHKKI